MKRRPVISGRLLFYLHNGVQLYDAQWAIGDKESVVDFRNNETNVK